jgi:lipoprotein-anchoring transpeptidase ErfK/SrfK
MAKYDGVISRMVASLAHDPAKRAAEYNRARAALAERLRAASPPLPEAVIEAERADLEESIRRAERQFGGSHNEVPATASTTHKPDRPRRGIRIAVLTCIGIIVVLLGGILTYAHWSGADRVAYRQLRQLIGQRGDSAESKQTVDTDSNQPVPFVYLRQLVHYRSTNPAGTVVIDKAQRHLYIIMANVTAIRYSIALGGNCFDTVGPYAVSRKSGEPDSSQSSSAANNSSVDRVLYLDSDTRLIHGTSASASIGQSVRRGCFLLMPTDLAELYGRVPVGSRVVVN